MRFQIVKLLVVAFVALQACNKEFEDIEQPAPPTPAPDLSQLLNADTSLSILKAAIARAGVASSLSNADARLTVFLPDNEAFRASGITEQVVNALPAAQLQAILSYHIIPQALPAAQIPDTYPNVQMPTLLGLSATNPLVKMSIFPSKRGNQLWVNNIPVLQPNIAVGNSVVHKVARVVAPPAQLLAQRLAADPDLSYLRAAIARADSGQTGLNSIDSLTKFPVANLTLLAPTNDAVRSLLSAMLPPNTPISEAVFATLPVQTVRGIVAYHLLANVVNGAPAPYRAFSNNFPATPAYVTTLVNASVPTHPGVQVQATFTGPVATSVQFTGVGNGGMAANVVPGGGDLNAVNGVLHKIDRVLLPQ